MPAQTKPRQKIEYTGAVLPPVTSSVNAHGTYTRPHIAGERDVSSKVDISKNLGEAARQLTEWQDKSEMSTLKSVYADGGADAVIDAQRAGKLGSKDTTLTLAGNLAAENFNAELHAAWEEAVSSKDFPSLSVDVDGWVEERLNDRLTQFTDSPSFVASFRAKANAASTEFKRYAKAVQKQQVMEVNTNLVIDSLSATGADILQRSSIDEAQSKTELSTKFSKAFFQLATEYSVDPGDSKKLLQMSASELIKADPDKVDLVVDALKQADTTLKGQKGRSNLHSLKWENDIRHAADVVSTTELAKIERKARADTLEREKVRRQLSIDVGKLKLEALQNNQTYADLDQDAVNQLLQRGQAQGSEVLNSVIKNLRNIDDLLDADKVSAREAVDLPDVLEVRKQIVRREISFAEADELFNAYLAQDKRNSASLVQSALNDIAKKEADPNAYSAITKADELLQGPLATMFNKQAATLQLTLAQVHAQDMYGNAASQQAETRQRVTNLRQYAENWLIDRLGQLEQQDQPPTPEDITKIKRELEVELKDYIEPVAQTDVDSFEPQQESTPGEGDYDSASTESSEKPLTKAEQRNAVSLDVYKRIAGGDFNSAIGGVLDIGLQADIEYASEYVSEPVETPEAIQQLKERLTTERDKLRRTNSTPLGMNRKSLYNHVSPRARTAWREFYDKLDQFDSRIQALSDYETALERQQPAIDLVKDTYLWQSSGRALVPSAVLKAVEDGNRDLIMFNETSKPRLPLCGGPLLYRQMISEYGSATTPAERRQTELAKMFDALGLESKKQQATFIAYHEKVYGIRAEVDN